MPPKAPDLFGCAARLIPLILTFSHPGEGTLAVPIPLAPGPYR